MKNEHSGAKNGGGHWGPRAEAKAISKVARRQADKTTVARAIDDESVPFDDCDNFCRCADDLFSQTA